MGFSYGKTLFGDKWYIEGCEFYWQYNTEEEMKANLEKAKQKHFRNLEARNTVINMLLAYRY